jgi:carbonic anhydrase/acetyltransferase-like protein (isoleucine patch superfamily)
MKSGNRCYVHESAVLMGDIELEDDCSVWPNAVLRGDLAPIRLGKGSNVQDCAVLHVERTHPCEIGEMVTIGHCAVVHGAVVNDGCLIGMNATVLEGSVIGRGSMVGANALVTSGTIVPPNSLVVGVPARVVKSDLDMEKKARRYAESYVSLKDEYLRGLRV